MNVNRHKTVFMVWAPYSARAENISKRLGANFYTISYKFRNKIYSTIKYPLMFIKTLRILKREKPDIILCQSPPVFCPLAAVIYHHLINSKNEIIIDAHTGTFDKPWSYIRPITKLIMKSVSTIIVTNEELRTTVLKEYNKTPIVLEDKIPDFDVAHYDDNNKYEQLDQDAKILRLTVVSSFAADEPLEEVLDAAGSLPDVQFYITGDKSKLNKELENRKPDNVTFTGFLSINDYFSLLQSVDAVVVLTKRDKTMLAGAYEALAVEKPLITSNWDPLKRYFNKGTIHTNNTAAEIRTAVRTVQNNKKQLAEEMSVLKLEKAREWEEKFIQFEHMLGYTIARQNKSNQKKLDADAAAA